jgi:uncharacterized membrane protein
MKRTIAVIIASAFITIAALNISMKSLSQDETSQIRGEIKIDIPVEVQAVIDKSCVMCHNSDSKNTAAKLNVSFDKFRNGDYSVGKVVGKLNGIIKTMDEGSMPPGKFVENNPQKKLTDTDKNLLKDWANLNLKKFNEE